MICPSAIRTTGHWKFGKGWKWWLPHEGLIAVCIPQASQKHRRILDPFPYLTEGHGSLTGAQPSALCLPSERSNLHRPGDGRSGGPWVMSMGSQLMGQHPARELDNSQKSTQMGNMPEDKPVYTSEGRQRSNNQPGPYSPIHHGAHPCICTHTRLSMMAVSPFFLEK